MGYLGRAILGSLFLVSIGAPAQADLTAKFYEGAPKDRFAFTNTGNCPISNAIIRLDLSGSKAGLIFDTAASGAGAQVYQPFEIVSGADSVSGFSMIKDGDTAVEIEVAELAPNESIAFTIDVDDTLGASETIVADSEITGASMQLAFGSKVLSTLFGHASEAVVRLPDC